MQGGQPLQGLPPGSTPQQFGPPPGGFGGPPPGFRGPPPQNVGKGKSQVKTPHKTLKCGMKLNFSVYHAVNLCNIWLKLKCY